MTDKKDFFSRVKFSNSGESPNRGRRDRHCPNGGLSVPAYRLYQLDGVGKFTTAEWFEAEADDAALRHARDRASGRFELWERGRLVIRSDSSAG